MLQLSSPNYPYRCRRMLERRGAKAVASNSNSQFKGCAHLFFRIFIDHVATLAPLNHPHWYRRTL
jgi:hypothetical protein